MLLISPADLCFLQLSSFPLWEDPEAEQAIPFYRRINKFRLAESYPELAKAQASKEQPRATWSPLE